MRGIDFTQDIHHDSNQSSSALVQRYLQAYFASTSNGTHSYLLTFTYFNRTSAGPGRDGPIGRASSTVNTELRHQHHALAPQQNRAATQLLHSDGALHGPSQLAYSLCMYGFPKRFSYLHRPHTKRHKCLSIY